MTESQMTPQPEPKPGTERPGTEGTSASGPVGSSPAPAAAGPTPPAPAAAGPASPAPVAAPAPVTPMVPAPAPASPHAASARTPAPPAPASAAPAPAASAPATPTVLDQGTYTDIRAPRSAAALALDGRWHQISPRYVVSQLVQNAIFLAVVVIAMLVLAFLLEQTWVWFPGGAIVLITLATMVVLPRQARAVGYMLRADDIVFRKGILWQRMIAVPYGRMQLVDITHGPLDRAFGVSQLKMVTAAATTGVQIPGLSQAAAEALRDTLIEVAETRRTGL